MNIHWPEALFDWKEPAEKELEELTSYLESWKQTAIIVYTKHDFRRNKGETANFKKLFDIIESHADLFIHLGQFSKKLLEKKYPQKSHELVYHPLLKDVFRQQPKADSRKILGIDENSLVVIAPGKIRTDEERKLVLKSFNSIEEKNKVLIATHMRSELKIDFRGRVRMKKIFDLQKFLKKKFKKKHMPPKYYFTYETLNEEEMSLRVSAADIVLIPRTDLLNSGSVFLGFTFNKVVVGPRIGNIKEQLEREQMPTFNPKSLSSLKASLGKAIKMLEKGKFISPNFEKYQPEKIAIKYSRVLLKHLKN
ncbi:hypothetical protein ACNI3T_10985 [Christiangramia sp. ASW11-125]|uniref:hypothetical protein n=1 Tax=Christiangramia sp. ASW11-125 TaxID=3400701 RepID=UPI003AAB32E0